MDVILFIRITKKHKHYKQPKILVFVTDWLQPKFTKYIAYRQYDGYKEFENLYSDIF